MKSIENTGKTNPFRVPGNYFGELNARIIESVAEEPEIARRLPARVRFRPYLTAAASFALIAAISLVAIKYSQPGTRGFTASGEYTITADELGFSNIDLGILEEYDDLSLNGAEPDISREEIIDYLLLENIEISEIYEVF